MKFHPNVEVALRLDALRRGDRLGSVVESSDSWVRSDLLAVLSLSGEMKFHPNVEEPLRRDGLRRGDRGDSVIEGPDSYAQVDPLAVLSLCVRARIGGCRAPSYDRDALRARLRGRPARGLDAPCCTELKSERCCRRQAGAARTNGMGEGKDPTGNATFLNPLRSRSRATA